ncbi:MAG: zinc-dependent alcohol dehydrogenase family protein [Anaerolineales bacterium]|nr:zinc-dependent alcohol dehydrogenase family protein [Anaerolineales bacterium]
MLLKAQSNLRSNKRPLDLVQIPIPAPEEGEVLIRVSACGVCHTELDEIEGRTPPPHFPVVPGHQVIGHIEARGKNVAGFKNNQRVGVAWIYSACNRCEFCLSGQENLCTSFKATGRDVNGGYAEYMKAPAAYTHPIPDIFSDAQAAPLLCAGAIGYRSLMLTGLQDGQFLGLTGFGASGHLVLKMSQHKFPKTPVYVFTRNPAEQKFALELGAVWAGDTEDTSPEQLHCIIDTTPAWKPVVEALANLRPGGRLVINAIRKEEADRYYLTRLDYPAHLWLEKEIKSVANLTRKDVGDFLRLAAEIPIKPEIQRFPLKDANQALVELKTGKIRGAKVLVVQE